MAGGRSNGEAGGMRGHSEWGTELWSTTGAGGAIIRNGGWLGGIYGINT